MVLHKLPVPARPANLVIVGQGPAVLAVGAGGGCLDIFSLVYHFSLLSPSVWETTRYRLKYCLKGPLSPKQPTNQPIHVHLHVFPPFWQRRETLRTSFLPCPFQNGMHPLGKELVSKGANSFLLELISLLDERITYPEYVSIHL